MNANQIMSFNNLHFQKPEMPHHSFYKMAAEDKEMDGVDDMMECEEESRVVEQGADEEQQVKELGFEDDAVCRCEEVDEHVLKSL